MWPNTIHLTVESQSEFGNLYQKIMPWFSYRVDLPARPLPSIAQRPEIRTERLIVRPILPQDLENFYALRSDAETQQHSPFRGCPDRDIEETRKAIEALQAPHDTSHWYFGAFLASNGEMIGEAGTLDCDDLPRCGWPEFEILIKSSHWRQGYGTEFLGAVLDSWWALPRTERRHQVIPVVASGEEPGAKIAEHIGFAWLDANVAATAFFTRILEALPVSVDGNFMDVKHKDGRTQEAAKWTAVLVANPAQVDFPGTNHATE